MLGLAAGLWYDFLRPLKGAKRDLLFLPGLGYLWLQLAFGVCQGDLRMAHLAGLGLGFLLWEHTAGALLRPFFSSIWKIFGYLWLPVAKIFEFLIDGKYGGVYYYNLLCQMMSYMVKLLKNGGQFFQ